MSNLLSSAFGFSPGKPDLVELPDIFPMSLMQADFVRTDVVTLYAKILTDVLERTHGIPEEYIPLLWDNCVQSSSSEGLVTMLAEAINAKADLFLVFDRSIPIVRRAKADETAKIREDYTKQASSPVGMYVSFKNYRRAEMVRLYSAFGYLSIASLNKSMNLSKAVQLKFDSLRASTNSKDAEQAIKAASLIATSLSNGKDVMLDAKDVLETSKPDLSAVDAANTLIERKLSFYLGLPASYITGIQTGGLSTTGEGDANAVERGLRGYFFAIVKPVIESLFGITVTFKKENFRQVASSMQVLQTFGLVDDDLVSREEKRTIVASMLDLEISADDEEKSEPAVGSAEGEGIAGAADIQKQALNGAQVASMVQIVQAVAAGQIPRDAAVQMIALSFQLETAEADRIVGSAGKGFTPTIVEPRGAAQA